MRPALLLVDLQLDFLEPQDLQPPREILLQGLTDLLAGCRKRDIPVLHMRTLVAADGHDRMPHWTRSGDARCVAGSRGAGAPAALRERAGEKVYAKQFYSAFDNAELETDLRSAGIDTVLVCGVHTHACVQTTVLDAYQLGFRAIVVADAIASYAPLAAQLALEHIAGRACELLSAGEFWTRFDPPSAARRPPARSASVPVAFHGNRWHIADGHACWEARDPCDWGRVTERVPLARTDDVAAAVAAARAASEGWSGVSPERRLDTLRAWELALAERAPQLARLLVEETAKPVADAEAELRYALALLAATLRRLEREQPEQIAADVQVRFRARGVIALITPWNNPVALPVGKIAPALAYGNTLVWKPAVQAPRSAILLVETLRDAALPPGCLNVLMGGAVTAQALVAHDRVNAVSITGSEAAGRQVAVSCALRGKAMQAELGGNNAAIVSASSDLESAAVELVGAAYSFAGQRCTAPRRIVVQDIAFERFEEAFRAAAGALVPGHPADPATVLGPLIARERRDTIAQAVRAACADGARLIVGGTVPAHLEHGCWYTATALSGLEPDAPLWREEWFGPLVVLQRARDLETALALCNSARQGLRAILYSDDAREQERFLAAAEAGILHCNEAASRIHAEAAFAGWKASGMGPPEHGRWDREFYARTQTVYGVPRAAPR